MVETKAEQAIGYIWDENDEWIGVFPPSLASSVWRSWLSRQDASCRRFVTGSHPGYWRIKKEAKSAVIDRFQYLGWPYEYRRPHFLNGEGSSDGEGCSGSQSEASGGQTASSWQILHLSNTAPKEVVDAAYKALQLLYHPDRGGTEEQTKIINVARDDIYKLRGW